MKQDTSSKSTRVMAAVAVVVVLAGLLAARLLARAVDGSDLLSAPRVAVAAAASVPQPDAVDLKQLEFPCWACREADQWSIDFKTDLDLLAPLGAGSQNAGVWFKDFTKPVGARYDEAVAAIKRRVQVPGRLKQVLPADDPLLLEAEPWCDQATMRFYPAFFEIQGYATRIPNLLLPLNLAKSWVARGQASPDRALAMEDFRRAIRLGRLLRQEDTVVITDLVGLACIRFGAEAIYELALEDGDTALALTAAVVLSEVAPQRMLTSERVDSVDMGDFLSLDAQGKLRLSLPDTKLQEYFLRARTDPDRRYRGEAIIALNLVRFLGDRKQKRETVMLLDELSTSDDPLIVAAARWSRDTSPSDEYVAEVFPDFGKAGGK